MLRGEAAARFLLVDVGPFRDADQRVVRLEHLRPREIDVVGGNQRQAERVGHLDMPAFGQPLGRGVVPAIAGVALKLHVEPFREGGGEAPQHRLRLGALPGLEMPAHRPVGPAGEADDARRMVLQLFQRNMRQRPVAAHVEARVELHQVHVPGFVLR